MILLDLSHLFSILLDFLEFEFLELLLLQPLLVEVEVRLGQVFVPHLMSSDVFLAELLLFGLYSLSILPLRLRTSSTLDVVLPFHAQGDPVLSTVRELVTLLLKYVKISVVELLVDDSFSFSD